jgi:iron complex outermembrane receptor protein
VVSRWSGSAGIAWNILDKRLVMDGVVRFAGKRFLDQDEANRGNMMLDAYAVTDVRIGGEIENFFWSFSVQNLFNKSYIDYGLDLSYNDFFTGNPVQYFGLYPLAGRVYMARAGVRM